jgi:hypothetical protein
MKREMKDPHRSPLTLSGKRLRSATISARPVWTLASAVPRNRQSESDQRTAHVSRTATQEKDEQTKNRLLQVRTPPLNNKPHPFQVSDRLTWPLSLKFWDLFNSVQGIFSPSVRQAKKPEKRGQVKDLGCPGAAVQVLHV